jgi:glycosidase
MFLVGFQIQAQKIEKIEPPYWWAEMNYNQLELMIYGENIAGFTPSIASDNVKLTGVKRTENKNYIFLNLDLSTSNSGQFEIVFSNKGAINDLSIDYELKERRNDSKLRNGFDSSDVIYLITPDRFANGDSSNDIIPGLKEQGIDRDNDYARHGGDIKGITEHLEYVEQMGFTAIWSCPMLLNDMAVTSYHGYAITDFYQVDPRFGSMDEYVQLAVKSNEKGIKLIMDQVVNHIGSEHWWMNDLPTKDWVNFQKEILLDSAVISNHRRTINQDAYAANIDKKLMSDGWFWEKMPDLNQRNPLLAKYLIQNSIWWIETLDLEGIRQDTYPYSDKNFLSKWAGEIMKEYPNFSIVGEEWSYNPLLVGYWQQGSKNKDGYESNLTSSMDFPMQRTIAEALNEEETWGTGLIKMYEGLANDFHYAKPNDIMLFPDNHDMDRIFTQLNENVVATKMALSYILLLPRIPQLYYGTEILMENSSKPGDHGLIRTDFPGGWKDDDVSAFTGRGLSDVQIEMQAFLKTVLNYRKKSKAIHSGKTIHFAPQKGVYVLFRIKGDEIVTLILNKNEEPVTIGVERFEEIGLYGKMVKNIVSGEEFIWGDHLKINSKGAIILTTKIND